MTRNREMVSANLARAAAATTLLLLVGLFTAPAAPAAALRNAFSKSFAGSGTNALSNPTDVAVDPTNHYVYVTDPGNHRVEQFGYSGKFKLMFGKEVDQSNPGDLCTAASGDTCKAGTAGSSPAAFTSPAFVAVDASSGPSAGDVYVGDTGTALVQKFDSSGHLITSWGNGGQLDGSSAAGGPFTAIAGITTDSSGNLYVYDPGGHHWFKFAQDGTPAATVTVPDPTTPSGIGVDAANHFYKVLSAGNLEEYDGSGNDVGNVTGDQAGATITGLTLDPPKQFIYADDGGTVIRRYDATCNPANAPCTSVDSFGEGSLSGAGGVAVDPASGTVYVADTGHSRVAVFLVVPPGADRAYDSQITGFSGAFSVALDAHEDLWVSDGGRSDNPPGPSGVYKYTPYPSQTLLAQPQTYAAWCPGCFLWLTISSDHANGETFVAQANGRTVDIFNPNDAYSHSWTRINSALTCFTCSPYIHVAIDNTNTFSKGRVYLSLTSPENDVEVFDAGQRPVDFPATASYIENNKLTGTPSGPFGQVGYVTVDAAGNLYVTDWEDEVVDEFDWTGTYIRSYPAPGAGAGFPGRGGVGVDPTNGNVLIAANELREYDSSGNYLETISNDASGPIQVGPAPVVDSSGHVYVPSGNVDIFGPTPALPKVTYEPVSSPTATSGTLNAQIDPNGGGNVTTCKFQYGASTSYGLGSVACSPDPDAEPPSSNFSSPTTVSAPLSGLTAETTYHYRVVLTTPKGVKYGADQTYAPHGVFGLTTEAATNLTESGATLHASLVGNGSSTHYYFEWGPTTAYGNQTAAPPGADAGSPAGPGPTPLSFNLTGLTPFSTYHYRIVADNGTTSFGADQEFTTPPGAPTGQNAAATAVHADRAVLHGLINPHGADTMAHFEYVEDAAFQSSGWANAITAPSTEIDVGMSKHYREASALISGLKAGTLYHYRVVGNNDVGGGEAAATFTSFAFTPSINDTCPNAHVRQQTGTSLLLDCRAYELVSAADAGGYDVESSLVAGQTPFGGYPEAESPSQVLYGIHNGGIPGTGNPTNHGVDPYVATRGSDGWSTRYVGIPANDPYAGGPFASTLAEAEPALDTLAFGGESICSPCFADGSTGTPVHLPDGSLVQGMAGSIPHPSAKPAGFIGRHLSADGSHLIFGSTSQFEPDGNNNGDVSIYDRNLSTGVTHVVSKTPGGATMTGPGIGELDVSADGSRVVIGQLVSTDTAGNRYWHLYMDVGDSGHTIDLTPGTTTGALYDGMSADGTKVYFTTADRMTGDDTDSSADIYRADVTASAATLTRVSTGSAGAGNTDSCDPAGNTINARWNSLGPTANCDAVAVGGGGGVASGDGTIYFLSPELLDGSQGVQDAPNLYVARPGSAPHFIRTLESSANAPLPPPAHRFVRSYGTFANPVGAAIEHASGDVYVFDVGLGVGAGEVFKFDSSGHPVLSFGTNGKLSVSGVIGAQNVPTQLAVDNNPASPSYTDLYVPDLQDSVVKQFDSSGAHINDIPTTVPTAVAVDQANGDVYVASAFGEISIFSPSGTPISHFPTIFSFPSGPTGIAVDSTGKVYVVDGVGFAGAKGTTEMYDSSGKDLGQLTGEPSHGVAVDPSDNHVYVDEGNKVVEFDPAGNQAQVPSGLGLLHGSIGVAADSGRLEVTNPDKTNMASFAPAAVPADPSTDSPLVVDSVSSAGIRKTSDFQVTPSGDYAAFTSTLPLSGFDNAGHREVFRYSAPSDQLDCASCNPTGEQATGEATLASNGLSLSDDGRVFFNSTEGLVDLDLNEKLDVYEWEKGPSAQNGTIQLISAGTSPADSSLLGVSADATDAYFFTHDTLVAGDDNGNRVKIYDARSGGGFAQVPDAIPCQASDECHGPGSPIPPLPNIKTIAGTPVGNAKEKGKKHHHHKHKRHKRKRHHKGHGHG